MKITYEFVANSTYYETVIARYYRQRPFIFWLPVQFGSILGLFACIWLYGMPFNSSLARTTLLLFPLLAGLGFVAVQITKWGILQRFKAKADYGKKIAIVLSNDGIRATGEHGQHDWAWATYPSSVRFTDGLLLMRPGVIRWLPDAALTDGNIQDAIDLVATKSVLRMSPNNSFKPRPLRGSA